MMMIGIGMPISQARMPRMGVPFVRVEAQRGRVGQGSGCQGVRRRPSDMKGRSIR